jgi:hypothetical protein
MPQFGFETPSFLFFLLAERKRFELSIQLPIYYLSRVAPSTTRTPLYGVVRGAKIVFLTLNTNQNAIAKQNFDFLS